MLERLREFFSPKPPEVCRGCEAYKELSNCIRFQYQSQIEDLRRDREVLQGKLFQVLRIDQESKASVGQAHQQVEPVQTRPGKLWPQLQRELELKHRRQPEDRTEEYWKKKSADLEAQVGLTIATATEAFEELRGENAG